MTALAVQPHIQVGAPDPTWKVGPLTPRETAGLLAEILRSAPNARSRPVVMAVIDPATDRAVLYITDRWAQAWLALLLGGYRRQLLPERPAEVAAGQPGVLPGTQTVQWWAEKPRKGEGRV